MEAFESKLESFNLGAGGSDSASDFVQGWLTGRMLVGEGFPTMGGSFDNRQVKWISGWRARDLVPISNWYPSPKLRMHAIFLRHTSHADPSHNLRFLRHWLSFYTLNA